MCIYGCIYTGVYMIYDISYITNKKNCTVETCNCLFTYSYLLEIRAYLMKYFTCIHRRNS